MLLKLKGVNGTVSVMRSAVLFIYLFIHLFAYLLL